MVAVICARRREYLLDRFREIQQFVHCFNYSAHCVVDFRRNWNVIRVFDEMLENDCTAIYKGKMGKFERALKFVQEISRMYTWGYLRTLISR